MLDTRFWRLIGGIKREVGFSLFTEGNEAREAERDRRPWMIDAHEFEKKK
jgi:hypothetical protein